MAITASYSRSPLSESFNRTSSVVAEPSDSTIFATDAGVTIGWIHYLAFDLFVGIWIVRDADAKAFGRLLQAPILFATFLAGPLGLLLWLIIRERRARAGGVRSNLRVPR